MWGVGNIVTVFAHVVIIIWLIYLVAFGALCAAPVWSIWEGVFLLRIANNYQAQVQEKVDAYLSSKSSDEYDFTELIANLEHPPSPPATYLRKSS